MTFHFADVSVDVDARRVVKGTADLHLTRKAFELLVFLMESRPHVCTKAQIHAHLWPDTHVTEASLHALVSELRHALGGSPHDDWLRTIHGVGYAVTESVSESTAAALVRAWLVAEDLTIPLYRGVNVLGRGHGVTIINAPTISRRHARVVVDRTASIEDLRSRNGTWVGGVPAREPLALTPGVVVRLGSVSFVFRDATPADDADTWPLP